jgi:putative PIN family toxin of toxin-antitoxin system
MRCASNDVPRAVIDTNVWASAVLNPAGLPARILEAFLTERFLLVTSEPLLAELTDVLRRPRIARRYRISEEDVAELVALLRGQAVLVEVRGDVKLCRDPDDDVVIATALRGGANALVTRDEDLSRVPELESALRQLGIAIFTVQRFLHLLDIEDDRRLGS